MFIVPGRTFGTLLDNRPIEGQWHRGIFTAGPYHWCVCRTNWKAIASRPGFIHITNVPEGARFYDPRNKWWLVPEHSQVHVSCQLLWGLRNGFWKSSLRPLWWYDIVAQPCHVVPLQNGSLQLHMHILSTSCIVQHTNNPVYSSV